MPLIAISADVVEKPEALYWPMHTKSQERVQIVIGHTVLMTLDRSSASTLNVFKRYRGLLEKIASLKFDRNGADQLGNVQIFRDDLMDPDLNR